MIKSDKYTSVPYLLILFIFALLISWPFFKSGTLLTDDGHWAVIRLAEMVREFKDLQIPPRWSGYLNHGYGYPLFNFVYPAPYYYGSLLVMLGFSYIGAIKFLFILSIFASVLFMFVFVKKIMNRKSAFLASLFYLASPYRLTDLYIRGSLGESLSFILFPLIFYLTWVLYEKFSRLNALLLSLVLANPRSNRLPHGKSRRSLPRAARIHCASDGSVTVNPVLKLSQQQKAIASYQHTLPRG